MTTPSVRERLGRGPGPLDVLLALRDEPHPAALVGSWAAGAAVVVASPVRVARGADAVWAALDEPHVVPPGPATVGGGWIGTLGYGMGATVERLDPAPPRPVPGPAGWLGYYDHLLLLDREGVWWFEALPGSAARAHELAARVFSREPGSPPQGRRSRRSRDARLVDARVRAPGYAGHAAAVAAGVEAIADGEVFQANLCLRVEARLQGAAIDLFARAAAATQPAFGAYVDTGERCLASLSPERFLRRSRATVVASPIKGTAPRDADPDALRGSVKDRAEHVMILDLMRNDLGRVCAFGTVTADAEPRVEAHPGVWHLVSDVRGTLRPGVTDTDVLRATFPPGSVTGAPKVQALHVISRLEATGREAYTGAIGLVSPIAGLELNVAIRTFEIAGDRVWLGAGGGIVADSDPAAETMEAWRKAAPLLRAAGAELPRPPGRWRHTDAPAGVTRQRPPARGFRRPDPARGVFETVGLDAAGRPRRLDAHLARLSASVAAVHGVRLDPAVLREAALAALRDHGTPASHPPRGVVEERAGDRTQPRPPHHGIGVGDGLGAGGAGRGGGRLRVRWSPAEGLHAEVASAGPARDAPVVLTPLVVPGGLGAHKWQDRAVLGTGGTPLLIDLDGAVLEAGWATVWALEGDTLVTPPADGRLLPGVTRQALLDHPRIATAEAALDLERLAAADAIVLTSAVTLAAEAIVPTSAADLVSPAMLDGAARGGASLVRDLRRALSDPCG